jgi:phage shock protein PspC (stress-responsive transcriptional regulator)
MDKITRIHLAKVPYEIGINAQIQLKKYLDEIRSELDVDLADEIMTDIEVRITEILSDRNIKRNDVITDEDISAIQEQLGSPEQFSDSGIKGKQKNLGPNETKKLLRDTDGAYIGGVASGLGFYFAVDPIFVRIIFVVLTFVSGLGILLYILLWLLVPAARTSSDKLLMRGEPVTAAALQGYRSTAQRTIANLKLRSALRIFGKVVKIIFTGGVITFILALLTTVGLVSAALYTKPLYPIYIAYHLNYLLLSLLWLSIMSTIGLMVVALLRLWQHRPSSLKIVFIIFTGVLVMTLAGIATVSPFIVDHYKNEYGDNKLTVAIPVNNNTDVVSPTNLDLLADNNLDVTYVITDQPIHASYQAYPGMGQPLLSIVNKDGTITLQANQLTQVVPSCVLNWCKHIYLPIKVTLYGPNLKQFKVDGGAELNLDNLVQPDLVLIARNNSDLNIDNSYSDNLSLSAESGASINSSNTTAQTATISVQNGSSIFGPASSSLKATLPGNCDQTLLFLSQTPTSVTLNGQQVTTQNLSQNNCVGVDNPVPFSKDQFRVRKNLPNLPPNVPLPPNLPSK